MGLISVVTLEGESSGHHSNACDHRSIIDNSPHAWQARMMHEHNAVHKLKIVESEHDRVRKHEDAGVVNCVKEEDTVSNQT